MKKTLSYLLSTTLVLLCIPQGTFVLPVSATSKADSYVVVANSNNAMQSILNASIGECSNENNQLLTQNNTLILDLNEDETETIEDCYEALYVEENIMFSAASTVDFDEIFNEAGLSDTSDSTLPETYPDNIAMVNGENISFGENTVKVGIIDSGIQNHSELNVAGRVCLVPNMVEDNVGVHYDISGHGTGISGVIAAQQNDEGIIGISPNIELYSIQVMNSTNSAPLSRIVAGIEWAIENDIDILNLSIASSTDSQILHNAIIEAYNSGILIVCAAGNSGNETQYPARYNEVLAVGSVDGSGNISDFSPKDSYVDILAPGEGVITTGLFSGYMAISGTSIAAPHVTAAAAVLWSNDKTKSNDYIMQLLKASANTAVSTESCSVGLLDIANAMDSFDSFQYSPNADIGKILPTDESDVEYYNDDGIAVGCWEKTDHHSLTHQYATEHDNYHPVTVDTSGIELMAKSAYMADELYGSYYYLTHTDREEKENKVYNKKFYPLHAMGETSGASSNTLTTYNSNFLADTKYLFRIASFYFACYTREEAEAEFENAEIPIADANHEILEQIVFSSSTIYTNPAIDYNDNRTEVKTAIKGISYMNILDGTSETHTTDIACKILGLAIHLAGDAYAHRTRVPVSSVEGSNCFSGTSMAGFLSHTEAYNSTKMYAMLKERNQTNCKCFSCFKKAVAAAHVEFRDIKLFVRDDDNNYPDDFYYKDDNEDFYPKRFSVATEHATETLILRFMEEEDFTLHVFLPPSNYTLRLNCLKQFVLDTGMNWGNLSTNTQTLVENLSTGSLI